MWLEQGETTEQEITDILKMIIRQTSTNDASTCDITLTNPQDQKYSGTSNIVNKYVNEQGLNRFNEGDAFKIYLAYTDRVRDIDTSFTSDDLIMTAELAEYQIDGDERTTKITLKLVDKTWVMLNKLWSFSYAAADRWTSPTIIQDVIRKVTQTTGISSYDNDGRFSTRGTLQVDARLMNGPYPGVAGSPPAYIQTKRPRTGTGNPAGSFPNEDQSEFPFVVMAKVFKPAYEFIKDLSNQNSTNTSTEISNGNTPADRNYIFYVDYQNRFHWFYPKDSSSTTLSSAIGAGDIIIPVNSTSGFDNSGVLHIDKELISYSGITGSTFTGIKRNYNGTIAASHSSGAVVTSSRRIVVGDNSTGFSVYSYKLSKKTFDVINMVIYNAGTDLEGSGILGYFYDINTKSKELKMTYKPFTHIAKDLIKQELPTGLNGNNNLTQNNASTSPFTHEGNRYDNTVAYNFTASWGDTVTSDDDYNDSLRSRADINAKAISAALTRSKGSPRWKGDITLSGFRFQPGELITFTSYQAGILEEDLRITEISHSFEKSGWFTTLTVEQDERLTEV